MKARRTLVSHPCHSCQSFFVILVNHSCLVVFWFQITGQCMKCLEMPCLLEKLWVMKKWSKRSSQSTYPCTLHAPPKLSHTPSPPPPPHSSIMHIKQISVKGFKSYREAVVIDDISPHHVALVGINGAGKSNFFQVSVFSLFVCHCPLLCLFSLLLLGR